MALAIGISFHSSWAIVPGNKRTILTSGTKVFPIRYQLGNSTVLYFGVKPETVICGNKNYFNIEKIKDAISIQPLSNFSTNLMVISGNRRYLFYLIPAAGNRADSFVEVRWVPQELTRTVATPTKQRGEVIREIAQRVSIGDRVELVVLQEKSVLNLKKKIIELEIRNKSGQFIPTEDVEVVVSVKGKPLERQLLIWEQNKVSSGKSTLGRLLLPIGTDSPLNISIGFRGKSFSFSSKGKKY